MEVYKKVIIFYPMTDKLAAGITFANLFRGWPADKLAVIADGTDTIFVKNHFGDGVQCIPLFSDVLKPYQSVRLNTRKANIRRWVSTKFGINDLRGRTDVPAHVLSFIDEFRPDILFTPLGGLSSILFFNNLLSLRDIPFAVHIMDDWPNTIYTNRFFAKVWKRSYSKQVRSIFKKANYHLGICEAMGDEYKARYGAEFYPFFNPVVPDVWIGKKKRIFAEDGTVKIVFAGKINNDTYKPILDMCQAVELAFEDLKINFSFDIFSPTQDQKLIDRISKFKHSNLKGFVPHEEIPSVLMSHDILFLPFSSSKQTKQYLKFSMSTNTAEYLISQTPILYYGPKVLAQYEYFHKRKAAFLESSGEVIQLSIKLREIIQNPQKREETVKAALEVVEKECSVNVVCPKFASIFNK